MAAVQVLPGGGSRYTSEVLTALPSSNIMADEIVVNENTDLVIQQVATGSPAGTILIQERLSSAASWASFGNPINVGDGIIARYNQSSRPFTRIRINVTNVASLSTSNTLQFIVQGFAAGGNRF